MTKTTVEIYEGAEIFYSGAVDNNGSHIVISGEYVNKQGAPISLADKAIGSIKSFTND
jgi:hypothetical protein